MNTLRAIFYLICIKYVRARTLPEALVNQTQVWENASVEKFREYLRIDTSKPENLKYAVEFWRRQAQQLGLEFAVYEPAGKPICVLTWRGADPSLPSIMLNSHMDVVTVDPDDWRYPPFEAHMDENGDIFGRGTQDTKDISIQQIEAIARLKNENITLQRTLHMTLIPDEETGSFQGMIPFLKTPEFKDLNVGFALDEGIDSDDDTLYATYLDKRPWQMKFTVHGTSGNGSTMPDDSAMEKLKRLIDVISAYRKTQKSLKSSGELYNNLNINIVQGGLAPNIVPSTMSLAVDIRLSVAENTTELGKIVESWLDVAGNDTKIEFLRQINESIATPIDGNTYWMAMTKATSKLGLKIQPIVCPATSDMIYLRNLGIPALGFAPILNTVNHVHGANEYLNAATFIKGIEIYYEIIKELGNALYSEKYVIEVPKGSNERNVEPVVSKYTSKPVPQETDNSFMSSPLISRSTSTHSAYFSVPNIFSALFVFCNVISNIN